MGFYRFARRLFLIIAGPMFRFRVEGRERVPAAGPGIVVAPHRSWLDPACVGGASPRPIRFLIMHSVYHKPWARWFYRLMRSIPLQPGGSVSLGALRQALLRLQRGELIGIFPEGRVVRDGVEPTVHPGAAMLAVRTGAPVIPLAIVGSARAWPPGRLYPGPARVRAAFGAPIQPPAGRGRDATEEMLRRIEAVFEDLGEGLQSEERP